MKIVVYESTRMLFAYSERFVVAICGLMVMLSENVKTYALGEKRGQYTTANLFTLVSSIGNVNCYCCIEGIVLPF